MRLRSDLNLTTCSLVATGSLPLQCHLHDAMQVSTQQLGPNPKYNSTVQFVVPMSEAFFRYMAVSTLKLELNQLLPADWAQIGRATLRLSEVLQACQKHDGTEQHIRNLSIHGPGGATLGTVRVCQRETSCTMCC